MLWKKKSITKAFIRLWKSRTKSLYLLPRLRRLQRAKLKIWCEKPLLQSWQRNDLNWNNSRRLSLNPRLCKKGLSAHRVYLINSASQSTRKIDRRIKKCILLLMHRTRNFNMSQTWLWTPPFPSPRRLLGRMLAHRVYLITSASRSTRKIDPRIKKCILLLMPRTRNFNMSQTWPWTPPFSSPRRLLGIIKRCSIARKLCP